MCQACKERWWKPHRDKCVAKLDFRQSVTLRACVPSKLRLYANTFLPLGDKGAISSHPLASWLRQWKWSGNNQGRKFRLLQKSVTILSLLNIFLKSVFFFYHQDQDKGILQHIIRSLIKAKVIFVLIADWLFDLTSFSDEEDAHPLRHSYRDSLPPSLSPSLASLQK